MTFNQTSQTGLYTIRMVGRDTSGNINNTETRTFTILAGTAPIVTLVSPTDNKVSSEVNITYVCNASDSSGLRNITLYHNISGSWLKNETKLVSGVRNESSFSINSNNCACCNEGVRFQSNASYYR